MSGFLNPVDLCGCGDTGYLTTVTLPVDLAHGVGRIQSVPVYKCHSTSCQEYNLPEAVSRRLEDIEETMEQNIILDSVFSWFPSAEYRPSLDPLRQHEQQDSLIQAFILSFTGQEYEDAEVIGIIPSQSVYLRSKLDPTEFYLLRFEPDASPKDISFSFNKFYDNSPNYSLEKFQNQEYTDSLLKELAVLKLDEVREVFIEEFGDLLS